jgi:Nuclease-related domain
MDGIGATALRRAGWRLINHYLLKSEIDHLLIGPAGVIGVETKWSRSAWRLDPPDHHVRQALTQVQQAAHQVELWGGVRRAGCPVRPVLFLWSAERGGSSHAESTLAFINGVTVIEGRRASATWRERVETADRQLSSEAIEALARVATDHLADRDQYEAAKQPAPPSRSVCTGRSSAASSPASRA